MKQRKMKKRKKKFWQKRNLNNGEIGTNRMSERNNDKIRERKKWRKRSKKKNKTKERKKWKKKQSKLEREKGKE